MALRNQLRAAILDGRLKPGVRLPSTRALSMAYGLARNTVIAAYDLLLSEGYISARSGSGTAVAESLPARVNRRKSGGGRRPDQRLNGFWRGRALVPHEESPAMPRYAFRLGVPDALKFPYDVWRRLEGRVERRLRGGLELPDDPQGLPALREAIAQHVSSARAVACGPADIVVTAGARQAFDLLARVLTTRGRTTLAIENPGYPPVRKAFAAQGARIAAVPVDSEGLVVTGIPSQSQIIYVTPSHQFPLGAVMSARRRTALLDLCRHRRAIVIEDDYDGEFRFADRPLDALQTLDRSQSVFYVGTFSKSLLPGLRLGYIVAPPWALAALVAAKRIAGQCGAMTQAAVALLVREGHLSRHVRKMQRIYSQRRALLLDGLHSELGKWLEPLPSVAGLHIAARLTVAGDENAMVARARDAGVGIGGLAPYFTSRPSMRGFIFGYGSIDDEAIREGLVRLRRVMS
jgi:GntR family transcriptional regulator/MocR family aminotransferase